MKKRLFIITYILIIILLTGCKQQEEQQQTTTTVTETKVEITREEKTLLEGTEDEFKMYTFTTNVPGPTIFIVGGTHGNEVAGYKAATNLLDYDFEKGKIVIVPRLSTVAIEYGVRYARDLGYTDLNRVFPGKRDGTKTEVIARTLYDEILYAKPDYLFDMHESRDSWRNPPYLGDSLIAHTASGNGMVTLMGSDIVEQYNRIRESGVSAFTFLNNPPEGTLNRAVSENLVIPVFTIETNRKNEESKRIEQQELIASIILETIWELSNDN